VRRRRGDDDAGVTLAEILVTTGLMAVLTTMITPALVQIYHAVNRVDSLSTAQTQVNTAFIRLDREVRYARGISDPAQVGADWYVEYLLNSGGVDTCVELRVQASSSLLQRRSWVKNVNPLVPSAWTTLADGVSTGTPFTVTDPDTNTLTGARYQRLTMAVTSTAGVGRGNNSATGRAGAVRQAVVTFTALNATAADSSSTCGEARGVTSCRGGATTAAPSRSRCWW
jgi:Tfp pilus assembly protein FimT